MNKSCRDDDACAELLEDGKGDIVRRHIISDEDGRKDTDGAGDEHHKQEADTKADVVVSVDPLAGCCLTRTTSAVPVINC